MWKRFIECQEAFFEAKKAHQSSTRQAQEANLAKKQAIIKRMEEIKNSNRWKEVTIEFNQLFDEWKTIGPVPYNLNDELWATFSSIRKEFFKRKDASREEREMQFEYKKSARLEQAHTFVRKLTREIEEEKEKLTDFNAALENITPGKKAKELKDHLEALISDSTIKIKRLGEKLEAAQEELNFVMANEKKIARQAYKK
ncbi:MAG: DUF349 domain-containing protein [Chitinophagia bacterium]|nr:DUF349 domain-containing protein [Chitinophagia bacterium]